MIDKIGALRKIRTDTAEVVVEADYIEQHLHHKVHWYGKAADQTTNWCDGATISSPYVATSGNNTWGTEGTDPAQLFSAVDTLTELGTGFTSGDFDMLYITANSSDTSYKLRLIWGTGTVAQAVTANQYTEIWYVRKSGDTVRLPRFFGCPKIGIDNKVWLECWNASNDATINFYVGVHAYAL